MFTHNGVSLGVRYYDVAECVDPTSLAFGVLCSDNVAVSFNYGTSTFRYSPMELKRRA